MRRPQVEENGFIEFISPKKQPSQSWLLWGTRCLWLWQAREAQASAAGHALAVLLHQGHQALRRAGLQEEGVLRRSVALARSSGSRISMRSKKSFSTGDTCGQTGQNNTWMTCKCLVTTKTRTLKKKRYGHQFKHVCISFSRMWLLYIINYFIWCLFYFIILLCVWFYYLTHLICWLIIFHILLLYSWH